MATLEELKQVDIAGRIAEGISKRIKTFPRTWNRASEAGHPCPRYLVHARLDWEEKPAHGTTLQSIFDGGNTLEPMALKRFVEDGGFEVVEQQRSYQWKEFELTGHIDAKIKILDTLVPLEVKSISPWDWEKVNSIDDFMHSTKIWQMKYPGQVMLYELMAGEEVGLMALMNKLTYMIKPIWVPLDYDYAESLCKKLELVNEHVRAKTYPEPINDVTVCTNCDYLYLCGPEMKTGALTFEDDPDLEAKLDRWTELKPLASEYKKLDEDLKKRLDQVEKACIGDYLITGKPCTSKGSTCLNRDECEKYETKSSTYWLKKVAKLAIASDEEVA